MGFFAKRPRFKQALIRLQEVFARPAMRVVVFMLALSLFYWPFITQAKPWSGWALFIFFFGAWLGVVLLLLAMGISLGRREKDQPDAGANSGER
jgi:hypothetical protein